MAQWLKQSTSATVKIGPFVDEDDGKTAETGLTLTQADIRLSKNGGNMAQKNDANAATHDEIGWYDCALDGTDTNTLGRLTLMVHESGALPVWHEYMVLPANIYDSLVAGSDYIQADAVQISGDGTAADNCESMFDGAGYAGGTVKLGVDVVSISGDTTAADNCELMFDGTGYAGGTTKLDVDTVTIEGVDATDQLAAATISSAGVDAIWDEVMETNAPADAQTARQWMRLMMSALVGEDAGEGDFSAKSIDGSKTRISGTLSAAGARSSVDTLDGS